MSDAGASAKPAGGRRKAAIGTFLSTGLNTSILSVQALLLMPMYQHVIGGRVYGAWLASGDFLYWMMAFDLGLPNLMIQRIGAAHGRGDRAAVGEYFATGALFLLALGSILTVTAMILAPFVATLLGLKGSEAALLTGCIRLASCATAVVLATNAVLAYTRGIQDTTAFNAASVMGSTAMFAVSLYALLHGAGLWSIPYGLSARALFAIVGSLCVIYIQHAKGEQTGFKPSRVVAREFATILPASALGGISYAFMSQSESILVGIFLGPEKVPILNFTRKGAEVLRALIDTVAYASFGAFAHLVGSPERARSLAVHAQITTFRLSLAVAAATAYMALNRSFVTTWAGAALFGGPLLTILIGGELIAAGASNLMNYLYRATGHLMKGSLVQFVEGLIRVPMMIAGLVTFGYPGIPAAVILTSTFACLWLLRQTRKELSPDCASASILTSAYTATALIVFLVGAAGACWLFRPGWSFVLPVGFCVGVLAALAIFAADPYSFLRRKRGLVT